MKLIFGLGNPGKKYEKTRHNIGSRIIDELKFLNLGNVVLLRPKTFMNESGKAINSPAKDLIVINDDVDLPLGKIKISFGSGAAGHKGVQSIIDTLGTKDFTRIRIGIGIENKKIPTEAFVLENFTGEEQKIIDEVIEKICKEIEIWIKK